MQTYGNVSAIRREAGVYLLGGVIALTLFLGFLAHREQAQTNAPTRRPMAWTHPHVTLMEAGVGASAIRSIKARRGWPIDDDHIPLLEDEVVLSVKFEVPGGRRNHPNVTFQVRDPAGDTLPIRTAWMGNVAYLLVKQVDPRHRSGLVATARQGDQILHTYPLPTLPPPPPVSPPRLMPAWPGLSVCRVGPPVGRSGSTFLLIDPGTAKTRVVVTALATSVSAHDACCGMKYVVFDPGSRGGPCLVPLNLYFPSETRTVYLQVDQMVYAHSQSRIVRSARLAVPLDHVASVSTWGYRLAQTMGVSGVRILPTPPMK